MSLPNRNNPYNFDDFLSWRDQFDFLKDDDFLQKVIRHYASDLQADQWQDIEQFSQRLSNEWQHLADESGRHENAPSMVHFDGHNNRIDRIVRPPSTLALEQQVWQEAVFSESVDPWVRFIKIFLLCELGESGINCAHCCTGGLIMILEQFADTPELNRILHHLKEGENGDYAIGAQFLSEIQGGSDVAANAVEAVKTDEGWRVYGTKFYCSAAHADYAVITAKPTDSHHVGVFVVPSWLPGDKEKERRNSYSINKLKTKLGTRELPTAEITYQGAVAYPLGDLKRGLANIVGIVLSHSRFVTGLSAGAQLSRVAREAKRYSEWRTAFGITIKDFGLVAMQIEDLDSAAKLCTAGAFKLQCDIIKLEDISRGVDKDLRGLSVAEARFHMRILIMLQKLVACSDSAALNDIGMSIFGGHGLMEDFSALPRMFRDASTLNGAWEGPRNLLLTRIYMDIQDAASWYDPKKLVADLLPNTAEESVAAMATELGELIAHGSLTSNDPQTIQICRRWDQWCSDVLHAYQEEALSEVS
ncbi:MAG: acyl-CoA dehydrogenase family protein [Pseudomonadales bacterium]|nr:acyl-CoA dehydrogenase family protein [Pseudomonadales bacterium]